MNKEELREKDEDTILIIFNVLNKYPIKNREKIAREINALISKPTVGDKCGYCFVIPRCCLHSPNCPIYSKIEKPIPNIGLHIPNMGGSGIMPVLPKQTFTEDGSIPTCECCGQPLNKILAEREKRKPQEYCLVCKGTGIDGIDKMKCRVCNGTGKPLKPNEEIELLEIEGKDVYLGLKGWTETVNTQIGKIRIKINELVRKSNLSKS